MARNRTTLLIRIVLALMLLVFGILVGYVLIARDRRSQIQLKSRYTYVRSIYKEETLNLKTAAEYWEDGFLSQYTQMFLPSSMALTKVEKQDIEILSESRKTVLIQFSAVLKDSSSEFFSSWNSVTSNGRIYCSWVVEFGIDKELDNKTNVYVISVKTPEEYGIETETTSKTGAAQESANTTSKQKELGSYEIRDGALRISYDNNNTFANVPVDVSKLIFQEGSNTTLKAGSYQLQPAMTAFLYGGASGDSSKLPLTLLFSNDRGATWTTMEVENMNDVSEYYLHFDSAEEGVLVIGYNKNGNSETQRIYQFRDGSSNSVGRGPLNEVLSGANFISNEIGWLAYNRGTADTGNLFRTKDGGRTWEVVTLPVGELDSSAGSKEFSDVFKVAMVPSFDTSGTLTVYLTQGENGTVNGGKTVAKYQSKDEGETWNYIGQVELNKG